MNIKTSNNKLVQELALRRSIPLPHSIPCVRGLRLDMVFFCGLMLLASGRGSLFIFVFPDFLFFLSGLMLALLIFCNFFSDFSIFFASGSLVAEVALRLQSSLLLICVYFIFSKSEFLPVRDFRMGNRYAWATII